MQHSVIAPSSASRWVHCPGSVIAQQGIPDTVHPHQTEGSALHDVGYEALSGVPTPTDVVITPEMQGRINQYITLLTGIRGNDPHYEESTPCPRVHELSFGTADYWEYDPNKNFLTIADYKDGFLPVSPFENWQLINYYAGILDTLPAGSENSLKVRFIIVQPRSYGESVKTWIVDAPALRGQVNMLNTAAHLALGEAPQCVPGVHCKYCKAMFTCEANMLTVNALAHVGTYSPELPDNDIGTEYAFLNYAADMIKRRLLAVEARAFGNINTVKGYSLGSTRGKFIWKDDTTGLSELAALMGVSITKTSTITPTQAKDAGIPETLLKKFTEYKSGKPHLVKTDMKKLSSIFGKPQKE